MNNVKFRFKRLTMTEAAEKMEMLKENTAEYIKDNIDSDAGDLRLSLLSAFEQAYCPQKYRTDLEFGYALYSTLEKHGFTLYDAADDGVWRYLTLCVAPEIVIKRWGKTAEIRFYKTSNRNYFKTLWRYIHLSWQGDWKMTYRVLKMNSTDQILNLVDRSGKKGYYVTVCREIMRRFYLEKQRTPSTGDDAFRKIMILHTAMCTSVEPALHEGGVRGYVDMLFNKLDSDAGMRRSRR